MESRTPGRPPGRDFPDAPSADRNGRRSEGPRRHPAEESLSRPQEALAPEGAVSKGLRGQTERWDRANVGKSIAMGGLRGSNFFRNEIGCVNQSKFLFNGDGLLNLEVFLPMFYVLKQAAFNRH